MLKSHTNEVISGKLSSDLKWLVSCSKNLELILWRQKASPYNISTDKFTGYELSQRLLSPYGPISVFDISKKCAYLVLGSSSGEVVSYRLENKSLSFSNGQFNQLPEQ